MIEWTEPFVLTSPLGTLKFNQEEDVTGGIFQLDPQKCTAVSALRLTVDNVPQRSGSIGHREYREGYVFTLVGKMMEEVDKAACNALLREMWDILGLHTNPLQCEIPTDENDVGNRRLAWVPTGYGQSRLLIGVRLETAPTATLEGWTEFNFAIRSPLPYVVDETETTTSIADGDQETITNPGNCPIWPNVKVYAGSTITYSNLSYDFDVIYDDSRPGADTISGGDYGFFGHFAENAFLNGDEDNLAAGVDITNSDFWPLMPGDNVIAADGADIDVIWNAGWRT